VSFTFSQSGTETNTQRGQFPSQGAEKGGRGIGQIERQIAQQQSLQIEQQACQDETATSPSEQEVREYQVLAGYAAAIRSVLQTKGQAPFKLPGLDIYETLTQIDASVEHCLKDHAHPLLEEIHELTQRRHKWDTQYLRIRRQQDWVLGLAEILDVSRTAQGWWTQAGVEVAQEVEHYLDYLTDLKPYFSDEAAIIDHIIKRTQAWAPGLFHCYEEPAIPRTDNGLEQYIGVLKRQRRRTTGHKAVADYITRHGPYAVFYDSADTFEETLDRFRQVSTKEFREERERFRAAQTYQRRIRSFRRDPDGYLHHLELLWQDGVDP
jgi:hypothetical protein